MSHGRQFAKLLRSAIAPAVAILVVALFAGNALFGSNGLFAYGDYQRQLVERRAELKALEEERQQLENRVALLNPKGADPDYADELVRRQTMQIREDEVVILTR